MADLPFWDQYADVDGATGAEGPLYDPNPWGRVTFTIAGKDETLPGICDVTGAAIHQIDVQKANGVDGGTLIERGYQPGEFDIEMKLSTKEQWKVWQALRPKIFRRLNKIDFNDAKTKKKTATQTQVQTQEKSALGIYHPALVDAEINACLIKSITLPRPGPEYGTKIITLKCLQYIPPQKAPATRKAVGVRVNVRSVDDPVPAKNKPKKPSESGESRPS